MKGTEKAASRSLARPGLQPFSGTHFLLDPMIKNAGQVLSCGARLRTGVRKGLLTIKPTTEGIRLKNPARRNPTSRTMLERGGVFTSPAYHDAQTVPLGSCYNLLT